MTTCKCWVTVLIAVLLLPNVAASADGAKDAYEKGKACLEKRDYDAAIAAFNEAIRLDPKNAKACCNRGTAYSLRGDLDRAIADYTEAIRLNPRLAQTYCGRGIAYGKMGEHDKAIADLTEAIRVDPKLANAYAGRGWAYGQEGEFDKSIADYTEAIRLDPKLAQTYCRRGIDYAQERTHPPEGSETRPKDDPAHFSQALWKAVTLAAGLSETHSPPPVQHKALTESLAKNIRREVVALKYTDQTAQDLVKMVREWDLSTLEEKLARARQEQQDGKRSKPEVAYVEQDTAKRLGLTIEKAVGFADPRVENGQLPETIRSGKALCLGYSQIFFVLGNSLRLSVKAVDVLELTSDPLPPGEGHVACLVELADDRTMIVDITRNLGFYSLATPAFQFKETFQKAGANWEVKDRHNPLGIFRRIQVVDRDGLVALIYVARVCTLREKGDISNAIAAASESVRLSPTSATARVYRAGMFCIQGEFDKAVSDYSEAIRLNPNSINALAGRGSAYCAHGDFDKAVADYSEAIRLNPTNADGYVSRGAAYRQKHEYEKAIVNYSHAVRLNRMLASARCGLGMTHHKTGDLETAIADYTEALRLDSRMADAYINRGLVYTDKREYEKAIADYTEALRLDPKLADAYHQRGLTYERKGEKVKAEEDFAQAKKLGYKGK